MAKVKAKGVPAAKPARGAVPFGAFGHPAGVMMEIAPGPERGVLVVRIGGRYDFVFKNGEPLGCATVEGPQAFIYQPAESPKPKPQLILPAGGRLN